MIKVKGSDIHDIARQLEIANPPRPSIGVTWRTSDFNRTHLQGCVVRFEHGRVPVEYKSVREALAAIKDYVLRHESWVKAGCPPLNTESE